MANWYGATRTNYVKVKDVEAVKAVFEPFEVSIHLDGDGRIGMFSDSEYGGWPSSTYTYDEDDNETEIEFCFSLIVPHLIEGEVLIVMSAGAEKLRYISGDAIAFAWDGRVTRVELSDIYAKVEAEFGVKPNVAEY